jgi:hypothetical protein
VEHPVGLPEMRAALVSECYGRPACYDEYRNRKKFWQLVRRTLKHSGDGFEESVIADYRKDLRPEDRTVVDDVIVTVVPELLADIMRERASGRYWMYWE